MTLVSCFKSYNAAPLQSVPKDILEPIRSDELRRARILKIRETFARVAKQKGIKAAKKAVAFDKGGLPAVTWSAQLKTRAKKVPLTEKLIAHSGLLCADLDDLGERLSEVRKKLTDSPHVWALFTSPTGAGLKCVFRVAADAEKHSGSYRAVEKYVRELCGETIDDSCKDVTRLCFLSHDPGLYHNDQAIELEALPEADGRDPRDSFKAQPPSEMEIARRQKIVAEIVSGIDWENETEGICTCPGKHLHTTGNGARDCKVYLDGAPTIDCFHNSCSNLVAEANRALRSRIGKAERASEYPRNDTERAVRFAQTFGADLRYVENWKTWLRWSGTRWMRDEDGEVMRLAQKMPQIFLKEAAEIEDADRRKLAVYTALRSGDTAKLHAMIQLAGTQSGIAATTKMFDADPYLLSVKNGVVDLRTGCFRAAKKEDYITKQAGTAYSRDARCPLWFEHLRKVFAGNEELVSYFQRAVGYSLTGDTREQKLFFLHGTGRNGKSTTTETLHALFGDYAQRAPASLFMIDKSGREPETEIARLMGARLVVGSETEERARLAESRVKYLTGQDTLTGRFLYSSAFDFKPSHKLWIFGNHKPDICGTDLGIWRRIQLVPFNVQIGESEIDPQLPEKLIKELPGILNWAIDGCSIWQKQRLSTPRAVTSATAEYRDEEDELGQFIEDKCVVQSEAEIEKKTLFRAYRDWACEQGIKLPLTLRMFGKRLRSRDGISERDRNSGHYWVGINAPGYTDSAGVVSFRDVAPVAA